MVFFLRFGQFSGIFLHIGEEKEHEDEFEDDKGYGW